jgi:hypothetical protein
MLAGSVVLTEEESDWVDEQASTTLSVPPSVWWSYFVLGAAMLLGFNGNHILNPTLETNRVFAVMINSIPYFVKRVEGSSFESTLGFYLTSILTLTSFVTLSYATLTSTRVSWLWIHFPYSNFDPYRLAFHGESSPLS